jgi:heat shock protein 5
MTVSSEVMAISGGDRNLGGEDFDQRVMQYFIKKIQETAKVDISKDKRALQKLRKETERVKRALILPALRPVSRSTTW